MKFHEYVQLRESQLDEGRLGLLGGLGLGAAALGGAMFGGFGGKSNSNSNPNPNPDTSKPAMTAQVQGNITTKTLHDMAEKSEGTKFWNSSFGDNVQFNLPDGSKVHYSEDGNFYKVGKNVVKGNSYQKWTGNDWDKPSLHTDYMMQKRN
jgi:hypothetical protein